MATLRPAAAAALGLACAACAVSGAKPPPVPPLPPSYANAQPGDAPGPAATDLTAWWSRFDDPTLTWLVEQALRSNLDLEAAEARVRRARGVRAQARAQLGPQVNYHGQADREQDVQLIYGKDETGQATRYQGDLDASWEIDLFGRERRATEAAQAALRAAEADRQAAALSVASEVTAGYLELRGTQRRLIIAQETVASLKKTVDLLGQQVKVGATASDDLLRIQAELDQRTAELRPLETAIKTAIYAIGVALGRPPEDLEARLAAVQTPPDLRLNVDAGVPADLVRRRPDIRAAEARLAAAEFQVGVAKADFYPRLSLIGSVGETIYGTAMQPLTTGFGTSGTWLGGASFSGPIFQSGRLKGVLHERKAERDEAEARYKQSVLQGVREVETGLVSYDRQAKRRQSLADAVGKARHAADLAAQRYRVGDADLLAYLDTERQLLATQSALAESDTQLSLDLVTLFRALGGGFGPDMRGGAKAQPG